MQRSVAARFVSILHTLALRTEATLVAEGVVDLEVAVGAAVIVAEGVVEGVAAVVAVDSAIVAVVAAVAVDAVDLLIEADSETSKVGR